MDELCRALSVKEALCYMTTDPKVNHRVEENERVKVQGTAEWRVHNRITVESGDSSSPVKRFRYPEI